MDEYFSHQKDMRLTDLSLISESDKCGIFGRKLGNKVAVPVEREVGAEVCFFFVYTVVVF